MFLSGGLFVKQPSLMESNIKHHSVSATFAAFFVSNQSKIKSLLLVPLSTSTYIQEHATNPLPPQFRQSFNSYFFGIP